MLASSPLWREMTTSGVHGFGVMPSSLNSTGWLRPATLSVVSAGAAPDAPDTATTNRTKKMARRMPGDASTRPIMWIPMKLNRARVLAAAVVLSAATASLVAQNPAAAPKKNPLLKLVEPWPEPAVIDARRAEAVRRPLFQQTEPLPFTLTADFKAINKDRNPESHARYAGVITLTDPRGREQSLHVRLSPRGHLRRMARTCGFVPLRVEFVESETAGTPFEGQTNLKLGTHCQDDKAFDQYVLREQLAYQLLNLVTPLSFRARLARATYVDAKSGKPVAAHDAIFLEHENDVARRHRGRLVQLPRLTFKDVDAVALNNMMLFNYMIGNTDFSLYKLHNVRVVQDPERMLFTVPYDFDLSGFVNPPYAIPDRRLGIRSVQDRLYRGPCRSPEELDKVAAAFRAKRSEMLAAVDAATDIDGAGRTAVKDYLESFFRAIAQPSAIK